MSGSKYKFSLQRASKLLLNIGAYRDGVLILITLIYVTGYITWSVLAWKQGLGPLPVLDAQYFVAGFPIILSFMLAALLLLVVRHFLRQVWAEWLKHLSIRMRLCICLVLFVCSIIGGVGIVLLDYLSLPFYVVFTSILLFFVMSALFGFSSPITNLIQFLEIRQQKEDKITASTLRRLIHPLRYLEAHFEMQFTSQIYLMILGAMIIFALAYGGLWYYRIPQELGGGAPQSASLDLDCSKLSTETIQLLVSKPQNQKTAGIARSREVSVFFVGRDFFLIGDNGNAIVSDPNRFKISREVIKAVHWKR